MSTFLLEIGTEELPADFSRLVLPQLKSLVLDDLRKARLKHGEISCHGTPRRIVVLVNEISDFSDDLEEERKGPPLEKAFKNNQPTNAAIGFANRFNLSVEQLEIRDTPKGEFVYAKFVEKGLLASELLADLIPQWIGNLQGKRFMRWGTGERRFSRPVRWLIALLDEKLIPIDLKGGDPEIKAELFSRGHRLYNNKIKIRLASEYLETLAKNGVVVNRSERKDVIKKLIEKESAKSNAFADIPENLLEELTDLVESPSILQGDIDKSFLELPAEVLSTAMKVHQRYVPLYKKDSIDDPLLMNCKQNLNPKFLCVCNCLPSALVNVKRGNERVLRARLADADFFLKTDLKMTSLDRCQKLKSVLFAEGLGTLFNRVERIQWVVEHLLPYLDFSISKQTQAKKAALLCKHDLVSEIVGEFPELQGIIGAKYLYTEGESREVSLAVLEQYLPKSSDGEVPKTDIGSLLAISERIELLLSIFAKGERPSGSSDPYALRRASNGILQILWNCSWRIDLNSFINTAIGYWNALFPDLIVDSDLLLTDLKEFLRQRFISLLEDLDKNPDIVQSLAGQTIPIENVLSDPLDVKERYELLVKMRHDGILQSVMAVVTRAARLAENANIDKSIFSPIGIIDTNLFESECEFAMLKVLNSLEPIVKKKTSYRYHELATELVASAGTLENFFDGDNSVMVMVNDPKIRNNRLNLLAILRNQAYILADFTRINN